MDKVFNIIKSLKTVGYMFFLGLEKCLIAIIIAYQYALSPFLGANCRFTPSCSEYFINSLRRFGIIHGSIIGCKRLLRCHPWGGHGIDQVPERRCIKNRHGCS